jgi:hypothetical protein
MRRKSAIIGLHPQDLPLILLPSLHSALGQGVRSPPSSGSFFTLKTSLLLTLRPIRPKKCSKHKSRKVSSIGKDNRRERWVVEILIHKLVLIFRQHEAHVCLCSLQQRPAKGADGCHRQCHGPPSSLQIWGGEGADFSLFFRSRGFFVGPKFPLLIQAEVD